MATKKPKKVAKIGATSKKSKPTQRAPKRTMQPADLAVRLAAGETLTSIATSLKTRRQTVAVWAAQSEVQDEVQQIRDDARKAQEDLNRKNLERLQGLQGVALDNLADLLNRGDVCDKCGRGQEKKDGKVTVKAVEIVFDRTGMHKTEKRLVEGEVAVLSDEAGARRDILNEAALYLLEEGHEALAAQIRAVI